MRIYKESSILIPTDLNLTELLHTSARKDKAVPNSHVIAKDNLTNRSLTLGELRDRAGRLAKGLKKRYNLREGDRWALILPSCVEFVELFHAILWVDGVACPINHVLKNTEIAHALAVSQPKYIFCYSEVLEKVREAIPLAQRELRATSVIWKAPFLITVIGKVHGIYHIPNDFLDDDRLPIPHYRDARTHLASIHLSSGTTGKPKGVEITHHNYVANCFQLWHSDPEQFNRPYRTIAYTPYVHIAMTTMPLFFGPWTGMMHHAMPSFDMETYGQLVESNQATDFQGVPAVVLQLAKSDITKKYDFSNAKAIVTGGSPFKKDILDLLRSSAPWKIIQVYGMTEASPYVAYQRYSDEVPPNAVGKLLPNIEAVLKVENTTEDAPEGGPGELWLRGPNITRGYAFQTSNTSAFPLPGWYNTGDVCTIDSNGYISVVGRTKELIKYKGFQVSPVELESHLNSHPYVIEAGISSVYSERQVTELPTAYVRLKPQFESTREKVEALRKIHGDVDALVSGYKKLRGGVWNVSQLARNPTGKIIRKNLKDYLLGQCSLESDEIKARL